MWQHESIKRRKEIEIWQYESINGSELLLLETLGSPDAERDIIEAVTDDNPYKVTKTKVKPIRRHF